MNINFNKLVKAILPFFIITILSYGIGTVIYGYLPKSMPIKVEEKQYNVEYKKYHVSKSFKEDKPKDVVKKQKTVQKKEYQLISNLKLKAIYATSSNKGWILVSQNGVSKSTILKVGEIFKGYKLKSIFPQYVIFVKNLKDYKLELKKQTKTTYTKKAASVKKEASVEQEDDGFRVDRGLLNQYIKNPSNIFREISISEVKRAGKIDGFKVTNIPRKSIFNQLGLKKGDIIKTVNNIKLKSYNDAFSIYKNIKDIDSLNFIILRDNQEVEIDYEIK